MFLFLFFYKFFIKDFHLLPFPSSLFPCDYWPLVCLWRNIYLEYTNILNLNYLGLKKWFRANYCSRRRPRFYSQYPHGISQLSVTLIIGVQVPLLNFSGIRYTLGAHTSCRKNIHIKNNKFDLKKQKNVSFHVKLKKWSVLLSYSLCFLDINPGTPYCSVRNIS